MGVWFCNLDGGLKGNSNMRLGCQNLVQAFTGCGQSSNGNAPCLGPSIQYIYQIGSCQIPKKATTGQPWLNQCTQRCIELNYTHVPVHMYMYLKTHEKTYQTTIILILYIYRRKSDIHIYVYVYICNVCMYLCMYACNVI